jgi:hypothetical protein
MKTKADKAYKLFHKAISVLEKHYKFINKGINKENLHAVFGDEHNFHYAVKVVLNEGTKEIETYVAIANPYAHQSLNDFKSIKEFKTIIDESLRLRRVVEDKLKYEKMKEITDKLLNWEE